MVGGRRVVLVCSHGGDRLTRSAERHHASSRQSGAPPARMLQKNVTYCSAVHVRMESAPSCDGNGGQAAAWVLVGVHVSVSLLVHNPPPLARSFALSSSLLPSPSLFSPIGEVVRPPRALLRAESPPGSPSLRPPPRPRLCIAARARMTH